MSGAMTAGIARPELKLQHSSSSNSTIPLCDAPEHHAQHELERDEGRNAQLQRRRSTHPYPIHPSRTSDPHAEPAQSRAASAKVAFTCNMLSAIVLGATRTRTLFPYARTVPFHIYPLILILYRYQTHDAHAKPPHHIARASNMHTSRRPARPALQYCPQTAPRRG